MKPLVLVFIVWIATLTSSTQTTANDTDEVKDPFDQIVGRLDLKDETIFHAVGKLNQAFEVAFSLEMPLTPVGVGRLPDDPQFSAHIEGRTLREVLTWLCDLDPRFTWLRDENTVAVFPRAIQNDRAYLLNLMVPEMTFTKEKEPGDAALRVIAGLNATRPARDPRLQLAVLNIGNLIYSQPFSGTYRSLTIRQILNRIAQHLGPTHGWVFTGTDEFNLLQFHARLMHPQAVEEMKKRYHEPESNK